MFPCFTDMLTKCIQMWLHGREAISKENVCNSAHQYTVDSILHANSVLDLKDRRLKLIQEPNGFILCSTLVDTLDNFMHNYSEHCILASHASHARTVHNSDKHAWTVPSPHCICFTGVYNVCAKVISAHPIATCECIGGTDIKLFLPTLQ